MSMKTLLVADKFGGKPFHREQLSKSFTLNMVNFLYMQMAQQNVTAMIDTVGGTRQVYLNQNNCSNLLVKQIANGNGPWTANGAPHWEQLGIRLGTGTAAPTPQDYTLIDRMVPNSWQAPEATPSVKMAFDWLQSQGSIWDCYGADWVGATFHVREPVSATGVNMRFYAQGTVTGLVLTVSIRRMYGDGNNPSTGDLASGTYTLPAGLSTAWPGQLLPITFTTPYVVHPGYQYALMARLNGGDGNDKLRYCCAGGSDWGSWDHAGIDMAINSNNSGASWNGPGEYKSYGGYQLLGQTPVGLAYSGTKVFPVTLSGTTGAQFILEALFSNYSGQAITASEVALMAFGNDNVNPSRGLSYMIAHDLLSSPITVNANEILRMRYIPSITV